WEKKKYQQHTCMIGTFTTVESSSQMTVGRTSRWYDIPRRKGKHGLCFRKDDDPKDVKPAFSMAPNDSRRVSYHFTCVKEGASSRNFAPSSVTKGASWMDKTFRARAFLERRERAIS